MFGVDSFQLRTRVGNLTATDALTESGLKFGILGPLSLLFSIQLVISLSFANWTLVSILSLILLL